MRRPTKEESLYWRKQLVDSGFDDLEYPDGSLRSGVPGAVQSPRDLYYQASRDLVNSPGFTRRYNPRHRAIIEMHSEGYTNREITRELRINRCETADVISELRRQIGVRRWVASGCLST